MKMILKQLMICGAAFFASVSCIKSDVSQGAISDENGTGTLTLSPISVVQDVREKNHSTKTRAEEVSPADFKVTITRTGSGATITDTPAYTCLYSEFPAEGKDLNAGDYRLDIESHVLPEQSDTRVHYSASRTFSITKDTKTELGNIECKVSNVLVSVNFTDKMQEYMESTAKVDITIGNGTATWVKADPSNRVVTFKPSETKKLLWEFTGGLLNSEETYDMYNQEGTIDNAVAGNHHKITFDLDPTIPTLGDYGQVIFNFSVVVTCETYNINKNVTIGEEIIEYFATIEAAEGYNFDDVFDIWMGDKAPNASNYTTPVPGDIAMILKVATGIEVASVKVETDAAIIGSYSAPRYGGLQDGLDLINPPADANSTSLLSRYGVLTRDGLRGKTEFTFNLFATLKTFHSNFKSSGLDNQPFNVTLTGGGASGTPVSKTLKLMLHKGEKPVQTYTLDITGDGIDARKQLTKGDNSATVSVTVNADKGIKGFVVNMNSTHTEFNGALTSMSPLDLLDENRYADLEQLGLPYGDAVRNKTQLVFDITSFIPMMALFSGDFDADFALTVTDNEDHVITKTIKLAIKG